MRPSCLAVSLLLLFIFLSSVQGIRLEESFKLAGQPKLLHKASALIKTSGNGVMGEAIVCKDGQCSGKSRKLFTATTPTSATISKSEENRKNKANPTSKVKPGKEENGDQKQEKLPVGSPTTSKHQKVHEQYADIMDITEMDYSPVRRKPPIHN